MTTDLSPAPVPLQPPPFRLAQPEPRLPAQSPRYQNFLILAPESIVGLPLSKAHDERITALARHLLPDGYVYVARSNQTEMEDDGDGIRYLPLRDRLPSFGMMTAVIVVGDGTLARSAAANYPDAEVFLMHLPTVPLAVHAGAL